MKIRFEHINGQYDELSDSALCEVYCTPEDESYSYLFQTGWLPTVAPEWYQAKSARLTIRPVSSSKLEQLDTIGFSDKGSWRRILNETRPYYTYVNVDHIQSCIDWRDTQVFYFDDKVFTVLNWYDGVPYLSCVIGTRRHKNILHLILPCMMDYIYKLKTTGYRSVLSDYLYIGEWYSRFSFKALYSDFEWWTGSEWARKTQEY